MSVTTKEFDRLIANGEKHFANGEIAEALTCFQKVVAVQPDHPEALINLSVIAFSSGRVNRAEQLLKRVLDHDTDNAEALVNLAEIRLFQKREDEAYSLARRALEAKPDHHDAREISERIAVTLQRPAEEPVALADERKTSAVYIRTTAPSISILIPTYNRSALLKRTLDNLLAQDYPQMEIVVVDDCSSDDTPELERAYVGSPRVRWHRNEHNLGAIANRKRAAEHSRGDYLLGFCDDDLLARDALSEFMQAADKTGADLIYSDFRVVDENDRTRELWRFKQYSNKYDLLRSIVETGGNVIPEAMVIRRDVYNDVYVEQFERRFITPFYLAGLDRLKMHHINKPLYEYRLHNDCMFTNRSGLLTRHKGVNNHTVALMFKYNPIRIFDCHQDRDGTDALGEAIFQVATWVFSQGMRYCVGTFNTGVKYGPEDRLNLLFYEMAYYWTQLGRKYAPSDHRFTLLTNAIRNEMPSDYDPVECNELPAVFHRLPWFAFRPSHNYTRHVALDVATLGSHPAIEQEYCVLDHDGKAEIGLCNHPAGSLDDLAEVLDSHLIRVINIAEPSMLNDAIDLLESRAQYFVQVINVSGSRPNFDSSLKCIHTPRQQPTTVDAYLEDLAEATGNRHWPFTERNNR